MSISKIIRDTSGIGTEEETDGGMFMAVDAMPRIPPITGLIYNARKLQSLKNSERLASFLLLLLSFSHRITDYVI